MHALLALALGFVLCRIGSSEITTNLIGGVWSRSLPHRQLRNGALLRVLLLTAFSAA